TGGTPEPILDLSGDSVFPVWPRHVRGSDVLVFSTHGTTGGDAGGIAALSLRTGEYSTLVRGGTFPAWLADGRLLYVNQGTLYAIGFDADRLAVRSAPVPVLEDVAYSRTFGYAQYDVSGTGTLVYRKAAESGRSTAAWMDSAGTTAPLLSDGGRYGWLRVAPDGRRVAFTDVR